MVIQVVEFSSGGKDFCIKINIPKGNYWIFRIGVMGRCQKLCIILENEVIWKLILWTNGNNKKCAHKLIFFNEKKIEKDSDDFWYRKFECQILALYDTSPLHQFFKFNNFLWTCWFLGKHFSNFVAPAWKLDYPYYHSPQSRSNEGRLLEMKPLFCVLVLYVYEF